MQSNQKILKVLLSMSCLFLLLIVYLTYFGLFKAETIAKSSYNQRLWQKEDSVLRGKIYDRKGTVLAYSTMRNTTQTRVYPFGNVYTHIIGYNSRTYGKSQLELRYNSYLSGDNDLSAVFGIADLFKGEDKEGASIKLTIDNELQQAAQAALKNRNGAIVMINPENGEVRAMASSPTYQPDAGALEENWGGLSEDENAPFLSRATGGLYAPGSSWKIITAAAAIEHGYTDKTFKDEGKILIDGKEFNNSKKKAYGKIDLSRAFAVSSNVVFASLGHEMGESAALDIYSRFMLGKDIGFDIPLSTSKLSSKSMTKTEVSSTAIGQGKLMVTPLYMALVVGTIANDGEMMQPYLVDSAELPNGIVAYNASPKVIASPISNTTAHTVAEMMKECVLNGTGTAAKVSGLDVYGKTGTAENERLKSHDWFVGYAINHEGEKVCIAVILEYNGQGGGASCAPIAKELFTLWFK